MKSGKIVLAGFGGQGILFAGKVLAYSGLKAEREVSWLPSYGPEMRGGTANCHVVISDTPVGLFHTFSDDCRYHPIDSDDEYGNPCNAECRAKDNRPFGVHFYLCIYIHILRLCAFI